jgi:hypothetical protein
LAFGNITTEGAQGSAFGSAYIKLDGNVFATGTLYIKGYNDNNFQCIFFGADGDLIKTLKDAPLYSLFPKTYQFSYSDVSFKLAIESEIGGSLGQDIRFHYGHPFLSELEADGDFSIENVAPFFNVRHMLYKMMQDNGLTLNSNFLDSDYGKSLDYSGFQQKHLSSNGFENGTEQIPSSAPLGNVQYLDLGTALAGNNSITPSAYVLGGTKYSFTRDVEQISIKGSFEYVKGELDEAQLFVLIWRGTTAVYVSVQLSKNGATLQNGINYFDFDLTQTMLAGDYILIGARLDTLATYPLATSSLICNEITMSHDNIQNGDSIYSGEYIGKRTQLDFLKGMIKQFNLVLDIDGDNAYLELQDEGYQPIGTATTLPSISVDEFDLTNLISASEDVNIDYLQGDLVYLNQVLEGTDYTTSLSVFPYQEYGSYLFNLNTFGSQEVETYQSYFKCMLDSFSYSVIPSVIPIAGPILMTWSNCISSRFKYNDVYDGTLNLDYINIGGGTTNLDCLVNWSEPVMLGKTWEALFKNTLEQKKNNKIKAVVFKDELGTIISNRRTYIIDNQKYKLIDWDFDLQTKLVKANLIMK